MGMSPKCDRCGRPITECEPDCEVAELKEKLERSEEYRTSGPTPDLCNEVTRFSHKVFNITDRVPFVNKNPEDVYLRVDKASWEALLAAIDKVRKDPLV